jgi:threonine dehydrogenase-like Zn-dependent dehydrogenase
MRNGTFTKIIIAQVVSAFCASLAWAAPCVAPPLSDEAIAQFKSNPGALVTPNSDTRTIEAQVRDLAGTSAALAVDLVHLAQGSPPRFQTAIAAGLAQAAVACNNVDQQAALQIQQAVASYEDGQFQSSFAAVAGDLSTAATAVAATSAAGAVGSVVVVNPNRSSRPNTNPGGAGGTTALVQITSNAITINSVDGPGTTPPSTTTTAANPVSPTR